MSTVGTLASGSALASADFGIHAVALKLPKFWAFLNHLPPNVGTHLMREDTSAPHKLAAKVDEICNPPPPDL